MIIILSAKKNNSLGRNQPCFVMWLWILKKISRIVAFSKENNIDLLTPRIFLKIVQCLVTDQQIENIDLLKQEFFFKIENKL